MSRVAVSVVIPTWNRATLLSGCLDALLGQTYPADDFEVIVADDGSTDETASTAVSRSGRQPQVRYVRIDHTGANAARNAGILAANGDIVCLVDDDERPPTGWLSRAASLLANNPEVDAVGGPYRAADSPRFRTCPACQNLGELKPPEGKWLLGGNVAIRRNVFTTIGYFDDHLSGYGEDVEWMVRATRAGLQLHFADDMFVWHNRSTQGLIELIRKGYSQGRGLPAAYRAMGAITRVTPGGALRYSGRSLAHCLRRRCLAGLIGAAEGVGRVRGLMSQ